jgi:uncharacterized membrane protein YcaP (DUF421 family)
MFFNDFESLLRTLVVGTLAYLALILLLRVSGKRTLSQLNAFDLIVTVAIGSTLATVLLQRDVSLAEGALALALLVGLQYAVASTVMKAPAVEKLVKAEPTMLLYRGEFLQDAMKKERVSEAEVLAVLRANGLSSVQQAFTLVLETNGSFSVTPMTSASSDTSSFKQVRKGPLESQD